MELDLETDTLLWTGIFWALILLLTWAKPMGLGFPKVRDQIIFSIFSLPCIYFMIVLQKNR